jgi:hypothetical protein
MEEREWKRSLLNHTGVHPMSARQAVSYRQLTAKLAAFVRVKLKLLFFSFFDFVCHPLRSRPF